MREDLPGIFCLEGEWDSDITRRLSVRPGDCRTFG